jgi:transposase
VINGIIHRISTSCQWRELPERFGPWQTVHKRHMLWSADGTWKKLLQHVQAVADATGDLDWNINIDSTSIRAHQHAAGASKDPPPATSGASKGAAQRSVHVQAHMRPHLFPAGAVLQAKPLAARAAG